MGSRLARISHSWGEPCQARLAVVIAVLLAAAPVSPSIGAQPRPQTADTRATLRVLFIGNSYTFYNNLGDLVAGIAAGLRGGPAIVPALAVRGGTPLGWHLANGPALSMLAERQWDYVVMQDHSLLGGLVIDGEPRMAPPRLFHESARVLVRRVRERMATPLFFMTWARRGSRDEEAVLTKAYLDIGGELGVRVAPVGTAWRAAGTGNLRVDLYAADGAHPSPAGSYLAACVIYATLTGSSPKGAPAIIEGSPYSRVEGGVDRRRRVRLVELTSEVAARLQETAWRTVSASSGRPEGRPLHTQGGS